jgi:hypothetical protein
MQVPVRARLLRAAGADQRGGGGVREGVRGGGAAVRGQGHRHLVQDAEVPRLGEGLPQVRARDSDSVAEKRRMEMDKSNSLGISRGAGTGCT